MGPVRLKAISTLLKCSGAVGLVWSLCPDSSTIPPSRASRAPAPLYQWNMPKVLEQDERTWPLKANTSPLSVVMASSLQTRDVLGAAVVGANVGMTAGGRVDELRAPAGK